MTEWRIHLGITSPIHLVPFQLRDRAGLTFTASAPEDIRTVAVQEGVNLLLSTRVAANDPQAVLASVDPVIGRVLDLMSFRLQTQVIPRTLEIVEDKPLTEARDFAFLGSYAPFSSAHLQWRGFSTQGGISHDVDGPETEAVEASMRWFLKGMSASNPLDAFAGYWLALEALSEPALQQPLTMRCCDLRVERCPGCGQSTYGATGMRARMQQLFTHNLGKDRSYFDEVWMLRNAIFHGGRRGLEDGLRLTRRALELKASAAKLIKRALDIPEAELPTVDDRGMIVGAMGFRGRHPPEGSSAS